MSIVGLVGGLNIPNVGNTTVLALDKRRYDFEETDLRERSIEIHSGLEIRTKRDKRGFKEIAVLGAIEKIDSLVSPDEIFNLSKDFGGQNSLRFLVYSPEGEDYLRLGFDPTDTSFLAHGYANLFDISIFMGKFSFSGEMENGEDKVSVEIRREYYKKRDLLIPLFKTLNIGYRIDDVEIHIKGNQRGVEFTPDNIMEAYKFLASKNCVPGVSSSYRDCDNISHTGKEKAFHIFHHHDGRDSKKFNLGFFVKVGYTDDRILTEKDFSNIEEALLRNGINLGENYRLYPGWRYEGPVGDF